MEAIILKCDVIGYTYLYGLHLRKKYACRSRKKTKNENIPTQDHLRKYFVSP